MPSNADPEKPHGGQQSFVPIVVRTRCDLFPIDPLAFDCVKFIVVRGGSAILFSEFGTRHVGVGDVVVIAPNTLCGAEPEDWVTTTTIYLDRDYIVDQVFWQYAARFGTRSDASRFLEVHYAQPAQVVRLGEERAGMLMPWLDELAALSLEGLSPERFYRAQALLACVFDIVVPRLETTSNCAGPTQRTRVLPSRPRHRQFRPLRAEVREVAAMLRGDLGRRWTAAELAEAAHLSVSQLRRVFAEAYGKSPIAYLTMLRAEQMVVLLRDTALPVAAIAAAVGWGDADFAARQFRRSIGVSPSEYRRMVRESGPGANARDGRAKRA